MHRFEYRVENVAIKRGRSKEQQVVDALNDWGKKGWRAISVDFHATTPSKSNSAAIYLERTVTSWLHTDAED
jgi:calcineurin-like phosphoesterase